MTYDCPQGWRWMDSAEALRTFTGRNYGPSQGGRDESALKSTHDMATRKNESTIRPVRLGRLDVRRCAEGALPLL